MKIQHPVVRRWCLAIGLALAMTGPAVAGNTYYVRTSGSDGANGLTPQSAFRTIQYAITKCRSTGNTVYVGPGTYYEQLEIGTGAGSAARDGARGAPNRIVADITGAATGDPAGPVIVDGDGIRSYGVYLSGRDYWQLEYLSFFNQTSYAAFVYRADNALLSQLAIDSPRSYGVYGYDADDLTIEDSTFQRDDTSGSGIFVYAGGGDIRITGNKLIRTGADYLSSGYGQGGRSGYKYGILVYSLRGSPNITVENNLLTDYYMGILTLSMRQGSPVAIAHNNLAGCNYPIYAYGYRGRVNVSDNIVTDSNYGVVAAAYSRGTVAISGLLTHNLRNRTVYKYSWRGGTITEDGIIEDEDPLWNDPAAGNFTIDLASPAIDAGLGLVTTAVDIRGVVRPYDGDNNGQADFDLGAYEYDPKYDQPPRPRLVQWRERERY